MVEVTIAAVCGNTLGEGPLWDPRNDTLYWVDIEQARLWQYHPGQTTLLHTQVDPAFTALGLRERGGLVVAHWNGFGFYDLETAIYEPLVDVLTPGPDVRFNDGTVDPAGRFFAGTLSRAHNEVATLYCLLPNGTYRAVEEGLMNSNGLGWNPARTIMYHTDTPRRIIYAYDYDIDSGQLTNRQPFIKIPEDADEGVPDGLTVDREGRIWSARWGGSKVVCYTPDGKIDNEYRLPARNITSCNFGGTDLRTLFITSAASPESPLGGSLFAIQTDTTGQEKYYFRG